MSNADCSSDTRSVSSEIQKKMKKIKLDFCTFEAFWNSTKEFLNYA